METLAEVPKYVRYDFLITFLGILSLGSVWYFTNVTKVSVTATNLLLILGVPLVIWGLGEMYNNYREERDLIQLQTILDKKKMFGEMVQQKILNQEKKDFLVNLLKEEIEDIVEKKKEERK